MWALVSHCRVSHEAAGMPSDKILKKYTRIDAYGGILHSMENDIGIYVLL